MSCKEKPKEWIIQKAKVFIGANEVDKKVLKGANGNEKYARISLDKAYFIVGIMKKLSYSTAFLEYFIFKHLFDDCKYSLFHSSII